METEEKKKYQKAVELCNAIKDVIPDDANLLTVIRACKVIIAECIVQAELDNDSEAIYCNALGDEVRTAIKVLREEDKKNRETS